MAQYVLAGTAGCPKYARAEILADDLSINLPDFNVSYSYLHHEVKFFVNFISITSSADLEFKRVYSTL